MGRGNQCAPLECDLPEAKVRIVMFNPPPVANPAITLVVHSWPQSRGVAEAGCYV
jgi:hypothetical protein